MKADKWAIFTAASKASEAAIYLAPLTGAPPAPAPEQTENATAVGSSLS